jgi:hypothetical protein
MDVGKFSMAELLANYSDKVLRKGGIKVDRATLDEHLDNLIWLFTFLVDKDLYLLVFKNQLARRLLQEKYEDFEIEKMFITNLKLTCGMQ